MSDVPRFGVPEHPGVPLIFAWGIHIGLSYQRPDWKQASLEEIQRAGIDHFVKWGANLIDLFPSNKEAHFNEYDVFENSAYPLHLFREHPDGDQEHQWTLEDFRALNRHAHDHGFLVSWMIHTWWPAPVSQRARVLWQLMRQLGQDVADVAIDGFGEHIDGYMAEGDFMMPEAANDLLWPYHPGIYVREAAWGMNTTAANYIQPRGFHLTDGRSIMYEREDYMGLAPECWRGFESIWRGEEHKLRHGRLFVSLQAEGRDRKCADSGWANFGGMSTVDMLLEQINNYGRAKGRRWTTAGTTAIRVINEVLVSPRMKRYFGGIASDPVRCAVAAKIESTGSGGRYPRVDYEPGTWFCQNNHYRLYLDQKAARAHIHWDRAAQGNFSNFLWETSAPVLDDWLETTFADVSDHNFHECINLEEAGALASIQQRLEYRAEDSSLSEFRDYQTESDSPWLTVRLRGVFLGREDRHQSTTSLNLAGYRLAGPAEAGRALVLEPPVGQPELIVFIEENVQLGSVSWQEEGRLSISCKRAQSYEFRFGIRIGPVPDMPQQDLDGEARSRMALPVRDWNKRTSDDLEVAAIGSQEQIRTVRILNPPPGPYMICENGWWQQRGAQQSQELRETDLVKVVLAPGAPTQIRESGFIEGLMKSAWGCQYTQLIRDVTTAENGAKATVRVIDINPKLWAPRLHFVRNIASATVDGQAWHYFTGPYLFLPNHRRDYEVAVQFGPPASPSLACTFASVESTTWEGGSLTLRTQLPEWCDTTPPDSSYYMTILHAGYKLSDVAGGEIARTVPDFDAVQIMPMAGPEGVATLVPRDFNHPPLQGYKAAKAHVVSFQPGDDVTLRFETVERD